MLKSLNWGWFCQPGSFINSGEEGLAIHLFDQQVYVKYLLLGIFLGSGDTPVQGRKEKHPYFMEFEVYWGSQTTNETNKVHSRWETILHGSLTSPHILWSEVLTAFVLDYFFKDVYTVKRLGRYNLLFQSEVRFSYSLRYSDCDNLSLYHYISLCHYIAIVIVIGFRTEWDGKSLGDFQQRSDIIWFAV